jgi:hypothetical protein
MAEPCGPAHWFVIERWGEGVDPAERLLVFDY